MAIPSDTAWEIETTGSDSNGGGFSTSSKGATGVDMTYGGSQSAVTFTASLSGSGSSTLTDASSGFANTMLGNVINISGQGSYCITAYTSTSTVTVDRALGTFSGATAVVGGARATLAGITSSITASNQVHMQAGTYSVTAATTISTSILLQGYQTSRGDDGTAPVIQVSSGTTFTVLTFSNGLIRNICVDGNSKTSIQGFSLSVASGDLLTAKNCTNTGIATGGPISRSIAINITGGNAFSCTSGGFAFCTASGCTVPGFNLNPGIAFRCVTYGITGIGFSAGQAGAMCVDCVSYSDTSGYSQAGSQTWGPVAINCLAEGNSAYGWTGSANRAWALFNCGGASNTTANVNAALNAALINKNFVTGGANSFFTSPGTTSSANFALNPAGANYASVKAAGAVATLPNTATPNYEDIGAAQHQDAGGTTNLFVLLD